MVKGGTALDAVNELKSQGLESFAIAEAFLKWVDRGILSVGDDECKISNVALGYS